MFIDQTKIKEAYTQTVGAEPGKVSLPEGVKPQSVFDYMKTQESYHMTENGSFFMPNATYGKPENEQENTIVEQLDAQVDMSAANRRNQMIVVSNTASAADMQEMSKDGFAAMDMESHTILTVTDKIKAALARAGVDISIYGDDLSREQLVEATGSTAIATQIESELKKADIPATKENVEDILIAYKSAENMPVITDASKEYLLKNEWEPSIKNLYMAGHSGIASNIVEGIDFASLEKQMNQIIKDCGFEVTEATQSSCKWLIEKNIALTTTNLKYVEGLNALGAKADDGARQVLDMQMVIQRMIEAIKDGKRPLDALLLDGFSYQDRAENAMQVVSSATDTDVAYCVEQQMTVSVENLQVAMANRGEVSATSISVEVSTNITFISAKRQLEETRLAMTTEANYALLKRGFSVDTKPLEQVVENLKSLENQYYKDLMAHSGVEANEVNLDIFATTTKYVEELKFQPAYILDLGAERESIQSLHSKGSVLKTSMDAALQSYETLWTAPRKDMGDDIKKAFGNIDEILMDLQLDNSEENRRAVRILAYNQTEITEENITEIKNADLEVQRLFRNLTPATTLELIRQGENPLDMEISELNKVVETIQAETGEQEAERFSKFLWKLEQNNEISEEERASYIGIYRLIAQVERTDGAAIGALVNQGVDITMRNILTAMRSKTKSMDYSIGDNFDGVTGTAKGPRIDAQIMAAFQGNCLKEAKDLLSPEKLQQVEDWEDLTPEQLMEALQDANEENANAIENEYYSQLSNEYAGVLEASDDVYAFLEKYDQKNSARNVLAAARLMQNPSNAFETLFDVEGKSDDYKAMIAEMKNQVLENFGEAIKTPEAMGEAQATLAEVATRVMQSMIIENETISVKDLKDLRLMNQQFFLSNQTAKEENFLVPVETGEGVTGISLTIVRGKANKGLVDIFFRGALMEKVAASFEAKENGISGVIATTDENTKKILEENLDALEEKMSSNGQEALDIRITQVEDLSMWQFQKNTLPETGERTEVQTKRLYHIAESFIQLVSQVA